MEKNEVIALLNLFWEQLELLKANSGPKAQDFIKWVRDIKLFLEKYLGPDSQVLREFKKIDYYPKMFDFLSSETTAKQAWLEGLDQAKEIIIVLLAEATGATQTAPHDKPEETGAAGAASAASEAAGERVASESAAGAPETSGMSEAEIKEAKKEEAKEIEKREITNLLKLYLEQLELLKANSGPKAQDFIKWVRDVKGFLEKSFGPASQALKDFKKIDYYPKTFDFLSSEVIAKQAWLEGLEKAKAIIIGLLAEYEGVSYTSPEEAKPEESADKASAAPAAGSAPEAKTEAAKPAAPSPSQGAGAAQQAAAAQAGAAQSVAAQQAAAAQAGSAAGQETQSPAIMLINVNDAALSERVVDFIKHAGYSHEIVNAAPEEGGTLLSETVAKAVSKNPRIAIVLWKGENDLSGKRVPSAQAVFCAGFLHSKLSNKRVIIFYYPDDIDVKNKLYKGLNFLEVDSIPELFDLKLAKAFDGAGLEIDFNVFKKK